MEEVKAVFGDMKINKSVDGEIPIQILKEREFKLEILTNCINKSIETGYFLDSSKKEISLPFSKKDNPLDKSTFWPVNILPLISKVYERQIYNKLSKYTESFLCHILCGCRKARSTQDALFNLLQT